MPKFEVFIPGGGPDGIDLTLRVMADHWVAALKTGIQKLGEQGAVVSNLLCDILEDNSVDVTDPRTGRVFRIREVEPSVVVAPQPVAAPASAPPRPAPVPQPAPVVVAPVSAPPREPAPAAKAPVVAPARPAERKPSSIAEKIETLKEPSRPIVGKIGREKSKRAEIEDVLAELFERVQGVYDTKGREQALYYLLDLAMEKIPADAGSVFLADLATKDLYFAAVRGPKSDELKKLKAHIPMGVGIVGFCAQEAVSLAISEARRDPRFFKEISTKVGYETESLICAPMVNEGRTWGCVEIINKKGSPTFTEGEMAILSYVSNQAARYLTGTSRD